MASNQEEKMQFENKAASFRNAYTNLGVIRNAIIWAKPVSFLMAPIGSSKTDQTQRRNSFLLVPIPLQKNVWKHLRVPTVFKSASASKTERTPKPSDQCLAAEPFALPYDGLQ